MLKMAASVVPYSDDGPLAGDITPANTAERVGIVLIKNEYCNKSD
jgi:hypothetical protein